MEYTRIPKDGIYLHMYCEDKHCQCDRIHAIQFRFFKDGYVYFAKMCMPCFQRFEASKTLIPDSTMPAEVACYRTEKWNEFVKFASD